MKELNNGEMMKIEGGWMDPNRGKPQRPTVPTKPSDVINIKQW